MNLKNSLLTTGSLALALAAVLMINNPAKAEDSDSTATTSKMKKATATEGTAKKSEGGDIDDEITNAKLRATSVGSKNPLSLKADLNFNGGNIERPIDKVRPNFSGVPNNDSTTSLQGNIGAAYRLSSRDVLRAGTGISVATPFKNSTADVMNQDGQRKTTISEPYIDYSRSFKAMGIQQIFDTNYTLYTRDAYKVPPVLDLIAKKAGKLSGSAMNSNYDINHTLMWEFSGTKWSPGVNLDFNYTWFSDPANQYDNVGNAADPNSKFEARSDYQMAVYPMLEYAFSDSLSFRTVFRPWNWDHYRTDAGFTFRRELYTQSVGIGWAATRDIYLYPNFQFAPEFMSPERTNVGLTTTINL